MTNALWFILGVVLGLLVMGGAVWFAMPKLMLIKRRTNRSYAQSVQIINESLQKVPDWRLKLMNDYQETTAPFGKLEQACSMNVCNPRLAFDILSEDANRGVLAIMPVAIGVYEDKKGHVNTSLLNVGLLGLMFGGTIARVMKMAAKDLSTIMSSVTAK
jgi:uncharacterized protein (DUF302 family)